ncbi:polymer-forming cytoskeletal protein [Candidatus Binatia bacterium]|nr:polymer-forming cytoskeletal protein [Candidatus Binatia bacterium]
MAFFGKDDKSQRTSDLRPGPVSVAAPKHDLVIGDDAAQAYLARGCRIEGRLSFEGSVRIDGIVEGEIDAQGTVTVGDTAAIRARIAAASIIVKGKVIGDLVASKRIELHAPGRLEGNITTPSLVVHEGVVFEGHCSMGGVADTKTEKTEKNDRSKVALFPTDERTGAGAARVPSEAVK